MIATMATVVEENARAGYRCRRNGADWEGRRKPLPPFP